MNVRERPASHPDGGGTNATGASTELAARYRSLFEIGRGGMGTIEVALEKGGGSFQRIVALKRMHPHGSREKRQTEMFLREARLAELLVHPNVVHAFDFGEIDGELFLAMEYVEGETLSAIVRTARERGIGALPPALVATILADACDGLHAAHELRDPQSGAPLNVVHRDVSPHNVMVSYEGHVKLLDFGVAKMDSLDPLTRTGEVKGKTAYMSPEQAMGDAVDRRSDLFSLGAVLFECVTGRRMYGNGTDVEVMRKLALEEPPSLADAAPLAPPELAALHARLVAREPVRRPESALAVAAELRAYVASSGVTVDSATIAETMASLFAAAAAERRRLLNEALAKQVPAARAEVLRRSLAGPTALSALARPPSVTTASAPPMRSISREESISPQATRSGVIVSALVGLAIAVGVVAFTTTHSSGPAAPVASPLATPTPTPTASASASATASATPTASASASATATPTPSSSASASAPPSSSPRPRHPKPSPSPHPVDVDPNPL